jgi:hypothetical protein
MSDLFSGPESLLTPEKPLAPNDDSPTSFSESLSLKPRAFVIEPPILTPVQKSAYKMALDTSLKPGYELKVDEVIGEYRVDGILYYFARHDGGIAYKVGGQCLSSLASHFDASCSIHHIHLYRASVDSWRNIVRVSPTSSSQY